VWAFVSIIFGPSNVTAVSGRADGRRLVALLRSESGICSACSWVSYARDGGSDVYSW